MRALIWLTLLAAALWGGAWWVLSSSAEKSARAWFAAQNAEGRSATYEAMAVQGFPSRIDLTIDGVKLADPGTSLEWQAPFVQIFSMTWKPWHLIAAFSPGQKIGFHGHEATLDAERMVGDLIVKPGTDLALREAVLEAEGLKLTSGAGKQANATKMVAAIEADETLTNGYRLGLALSDLTIDDVATLAKRAAPDLPTSISEVSLDATAIFTVPLDGHSSAVPGLLGLDVRRARLVWGSVEATFMGEVTADGDGWPAGKLSVRIAGWRDLVAILRESKRLPDKMMNEVEQVLEDTANSGADPDVLEMPLDIEGGVMRLGKIRLGRLAQFN